MQSKNYLSNKKFGYFFGFIFLMIWVYGCWRRDTTKVGLTFFLGGLFIAIAFFEPGVFKPLKTIWLNLGHCMGKICNPIIMAVLYFLVITPFALIARAVFGYDPLGKKLKSDQSFWITKQPITNYKEFFKNQF